MIPVRDNPIPGRIKKELPPYVKRRVAAPFTGAPGGARF